MGIDSISEDIDPDRTDKGGSETLERAMRDLNAGLKGNTSIPNSVYITNGIGYGKYVDAKTGMVRIAAAQVEAFAKVAWKGVAQVQRFGK